MIDPSARRGIAVMEIVVVALILGVLLAIAIPRFTRPRLELVQGPGTEIRAGGSGTLAVRVTSWRGAAQPGVPVAFETEDGIAVTPALVRTDSSGVATTTWFAGPGGGTATIRAHVEGRDLPSVSIATRASAGAPAAPARPAVAPAPATMDSAAADSPAADSPAADSPRADSATAPR